jgi:hypothetical protein
MTLLVAACGGADPADDAGPDTTSAGPAVSSGDEPSPSTSNPAEETPDTSPAVAGLGEASITIEGETLHFGETSFPALRCEPDMFGVFWVLLGQVDEQGDEVADGGLLELKLLLGGTDPDEVGQVPESMLRLPERDQEWIADREQIELSSTDPLPGELDPGTSQIDEYTIDGNSISGTATFFEENSWFAYSAGNAANYLTATATFEATCAGDG